MSIALSGITLTGLPDADPGKKDGISDPYCVFTLQRVADGSTLGSTTTEMLANRRNAKFSDPPPITFSETFEAAKLKVDIIDEDGAVDDMLGTVTFEV